MATEIQGWLRRGEGLPCTTVLVYLAPGVQRVTSDVDWKSVLHKGIDVSVTIWELRQELRVKSLELYVLPVHTCYRGCYWLDNGLCVCILHISQEIRGKDIRLEDRICHECSQMEFDHEKYVLRYAYLFVSPLSLCIVVLCCTVLYWPFLPFYLYMYI